jgi:hypothetical protein
VSRATILDAGFGWRGEGCAKDAKGAKSTKTKGGNGIENVSVHLFFLLSPSVLSFVFLPIFAFLAPFAHSFFTEDLEPRRL